MTNNDSYIYSSFGYMGGAFTLIKNVLECYTDDSYKVKRVAEIVDDVRKHLEGKYKECNVDSVALHPDTIL